AELAVAPPRLPIVSLGGFAGCGEIRAVPLVAHRGTESAWSDLLDAAIAQPVVMRGQRVEPRGHAEDLAQSSPPRRVRDHGADRPAARAPVAGLALAHPAQLPQPVDPRGVVLDRRHRLAVALARAVTGMPVAGRGRSDDAVTRDDAS